MNKEEFSKYLKEAFDSIQIKINEEQEEKFYKYMCMLLEWNEKINLTAIVEPKEIIIKHFIDSAILLTKQKIEGKCIDIGTGAGFPGIPIKILKDELEVTLVDSLNKRVVFLNEVINKLNLKNITAIHSRAEELGQNKVYREQYDIVLSRAVARINILAEYTVPFAKINGKVIFMKSQEIKEELNEGKMAIKKLGGKIERQDEFIIPKTDIKRTLIIIEKEKNTLNKYPRKAGIVKKQPII